MDKEYTTPTQALKKLRAARSLQQIIVIDDLHMLKNETAQQAILSLLKRKDIWMIMLSRSSVPAWLRAERVPLDAFFATTVLREIEEGDEAKL